MACKRPPTANLITDVLRNIAAQPDVVRQFDDYVGRMVTI